MTDSIVADGFVAGGFGDDLAGEHVLLGGLGEARRQQCISKEALAR